MCGKRQAVRRTRRAPANPPLPAAGTCCCCLRCCHYIRSKQCSCGHKFAPSKLAQLRTAPLLRVPLWDGKGDLGPAKIGGKDRETYPRNNQQALSCMEKFVKAELAHVSGLHAGSRPMRACNARSMRMRTQHEHVHVQHSTRTRAHTLTPCLQCMLLRRWRSMPGQWGAQ